MDFSKLSKTEQLVSIGALLGVISSFLPWYTTSVDTYLGTNSSAVSGLNAGAWGNGWIILSFIAALLCLLLVGLPMFGVKLPKFGVETNVLYMIFGGFVGGIAVLALISTPSWFGIKASSSFGLWAAIGAGALILYGAFLEKSTSKPSVPTEAPKK